MSRFITNAGGATYLVNEAEYDRLIKTKGFRAATNEEIAAWRARHWPEPDSSAQTPSDAQPVAQPVLPTGESGNAQSVAGGTTTAPDNSAPVSSTGDANNSQATTDESRPDSARSSKKRARKGRK